MSKHTQGPWKINSDGIIEYTIHEYYKMGA